MLLHRWDKYVKTIINAILSKITVYTCAFNVMKASMQKRKDVFRKEIIESHITDTKLI